MKKPLMVVASTVLALLASFVPVSLANAADPVCTVNVTESNTTVQGTNLGDVICITGDNNIVNALGGDDTVIDDGIDNTINLGEGFDIYDGSGGDGSTVDGGPGNDDITGTPGEDELTGGDGDDTLIGGEGDDTLNGGLGADELAGNAGDDTINGEAGNDTADGGDGSDLINGGDGDDTLIGGTNNDTLNGGLGADELSGNAGDDNIFGESGSDFLSGGEGDDILAGGQNVDEIFGGAGLNICDFSSGEALTQSCRYDDSPPTLIDLDFSQATIDSSTTATPQTISMRVADEIGIESIQLICSTPRVTGVYKAIDVTWTGSKAVDNFNSQTLGQFLREGPDNNLTLTATYQIQRGSHPGTYSCRVILRDILNHESNVEIDPYFVITRTGQGWDDSAPSTTVFEFSEQVVDNIEPNNTTQLHFTLTDQTDIGWGYVTCENEVGSRAVELIYNESTVYDYKTGFRTIPIESSGRKLEYKVDLVVRAGQAPGLYTCSISKKDSMHHEAFQSNAAVLEIQDSMGTSDISGPVLVSTNFSDTKFESGLGPSSGTLTFHLRDANSLGWSYLNCEFSKNGVLHRILGAGVEPGRFYDYDNGWVGGASFEGPPNDMVFRIPINIPFGTYPGSYECWIGATDKFANGSRYLLASFDVYRTPAGLPSTPKKLEVDFGSPTTGALRWATPEFIGEPALLGYVSEYSTDGQKWTTLPTGATSSTLLNISGLKANSDYFFRVRGDNGGTVGQDTTYMSLNWATIQVRTPAPILSDAPADLVVSNVTSNGYKLTWSVPAYNGGSEITDFKVEVSSDSGNTWRPAKQIESTSLTLSVSGAAPGTNYLVRVAAVNAVGLSEYLFGSLITLAVAPSAPRSVTSSGITSTSLTLSWLLPASNGGSAITDYMVEVSSNGGLAWSTIDDGVSSNLAVDVSNLLKNKSYLFRVSAVNSVGLGSVSDVFTVSTLATVPSVPSDLTTSDLQSTSVVLGWSAPADFGGVSLTDYVVETSRDGIAWSVVPHAVSVARSLKITGLVPGVTYQTRVSAVSSVGQSEYLTGSFTTPLAVPNVPRSLTISSVTSTSLTLKWLLPSSNGGSAITDYRVEVSSNCSTYKAINRAVSVNLGFKVTGLKAGTKYCFRVAAKNEIGFSSVSSILQVTTVGKAPAAPTSLSVKAAKTSVTLGWKAAAVTGGSAVRNYIVEYSKNNGVSWLKVTKPVSTSRSLTIKGLRSRTTYLFRVTAVNDVGNSKASKSLKVATG